MIELLSCALIAASTGADAGGEIVASLQAATPEARLHAVRVARSPGAKRDLFIVDASLPKRMEIAFAFWVVRDQERIILIDTGFLSANVSGWRIEDFRSPIDGLRAIGIDPTRVTDVVVTHSHWDHTGGLWRYENARWWLTEPTLRSLRRRGATSAPKLKAGLSRADDQGRLRRVSGPRRVTPYLAVIPAGLHTRGFMYAVMARSDG
ncbi:MAG: MBL fold metallo-hydrolase, partial [Myxococcota bacterium]